MNKKISELRLWKDNPRGIKKEHFDRLKSQIERLGLYKPFIITPDGEVLGGNMRLRACRELGIKEAPVSIVEPKSEAEKLEYALSDNDRAGYYEEDKLAELIDKYKDEIELGGYHIDLGKTIDLDELLDRYSPVEEDEVPEIEEGEPISKYGEVYQLGRHRLMCGDSTKKEDVEKLMNGKKADMVFTDPPYNVGYEYTQQEDNKSSKDYEKFISNYMDILALYSKTIVVTPGKGNEHYYYKNFDVKDSAIWHKKFATTRGGWYRAMTTEPVLFFGEKPKGKFLRQDYLEYSTDRIEGLRKQHSCPKPIGLVGEFVKTFSNKDNIILDLFGGSGSTLIACEQTNRICYMMEIDPKYCDVIKKRYANFTEK